MPAKIVSHSISPFTRSHNCDHYLETQASLRISTIDSRGCSVIFPEYVVPRTSLHSPARSMVRGRMVELYSSRNTCGSDSFTVTSCNATLSSQKLPSRSLNPHSMADP